MSQIPIYVFTGFLSTGKTSWMEYMLQEGLSGWPAIVAFEEGVQNFSEPHFSISLTNDNMSRKALKKIGQNIIEYIEKRNADALWIEWNGMLPFSLLERLVLETDLKRYATLNHVFYITSPMYVNNMMGQTGDANLSQLAKADTIVLTGNQNSSRDHEAWQEACKTLHLYMPRIAVIPFTVAVKDVLKQIKQKRQSLQKDISLLLTTAMLVYFLIIHFAPTLISKPAMQVLVMCNGILMQAFPFLVLGIILATVLQFFVPTRIIDALLTGNPIKAVFAALVSGFFFPLCDCATIPLFQGMVNRKVPVGIGLIFMLVSPLINPVVILSTYYAFSGNFQFVVGRAVLGIVVAILTGLSFWRYKGLHLSSTGLTSAKYRTQIMATTFRQNVRYGLLDGRKRSSFEVAVKHGKEEFFMMGTYLVGGALLSSLFQVYGAPILRQYGIIHSAPITILLLMIFAFLISLCSTSDAMVARSMANLFPKGAVMGFLLFGPLIDLKNVFMLSSLFPKSFVWRLSGTVFIWSFLAALGFTYYMGGLQ